MKSIDTPNSGFSMVELVVGIAITGVLMAITLNTVLGTKKQSDQTMKDMLSAADQVIADRQLWFDLRTIASSFNNLNIPDDNGRNFFDYFSDVPCTSNCTRSFTLTPANNAEMVVIAGDDSVGPPMMYDPVGAYSATPSGNFNVAGALNFMGLNYQPSAQPDGTMELLYPSDRYPEFWAPPFRLLLLYSPITMREAVTGVPNMTKPPRSSYILVRYNTRDELNASPPPVNIGGRTIAEHPSDSSIAIDSVDKFFRTLPPVGGSVGLAFIKPVSVLRYQVVEVPDGNAPGGRSGQLRRSVWSAEQGTWGQAQTLSDGLKSVVFCRSNVGAAVMTAALNMARAVGHSKIAPPEKQCADLF